jgi:hypothetical protein
MAGRLNRDAPCCSNSVHGPHQPCDLQGTAGEQTIIRGRVGLALDCRSGPGPTTARCWARSSSDQGAGFAAANDLGGKGNVAMRQSRERLDLFWTQRHLVTCIKMRADVLTNLLPQQGGLPKRGCGRDGKCSGRQALLANRDRRALWPFSPTPADIGF